MPGTQSPWVLLLFVVGLVTGLAASVLIGPGLSGVLVVAGGMVGLGVGGLFSGRPLDPRWLPVESPDGDDH